MIGISKDNHSDTTLPLCEASPEKNAVGKRLDVGQYGRARRGETGHGFKVGIRDVVDIAAQIEGQHPQQGEKSPCQAYGQHPFTASGGMLVGPQPDQSKKNACPEHDTARLQ